jgi:hypothetical protein
MARPHLTYFVELPSAALAQLFCDGTVAEHLARMGSAVSMGLLDLTPERAAIVRDLERRGVPVTAWLLLDVAHGYWLNADNPAHGRDRYRETIAWAANEGLHLHRIGLDIEFPRSDGDYLMRKGARGLLTLLRRRRSAAQVREAQQRYAELVDEIRAGGRQVESYHFPYIVDERSAGTTLLRRTLGLVDVDVDVDVFMLYSSYLGRLGARGYFADAGAIALGVTGGGVNAGTAAEAARVLTWERFEDDLRAAAAHAGEVYVFSLEGCVEQSFLPRLEAFDWERGAAPLKPQEQRRMRQIRFVARTLLRSERLLDVVLPSRRAH